MIRHNVFVYGTLRSEGSNPAEKFVDAEVVGVAKADGQIYNLGWFPGFKVGDGVVTGELIRVTEEALERLDAYEGCPHLYTREERLVRNEKGEDVLTYIYVYNGNVHNDDLVPHGDWIAEALSKEIA